ncbi:unnamed protein product [Amaranthus hypochondriacus]
MEEQIKEKEAIKIEDKEVKLVHYFDSSMSNQLLRKFPDNSVFDFDYSQSSIWSPLVPRFHSLSCLNPKSPDFSSKKLVFDQISHSKSNFKKRICNFGLNLNAKLHKKNKKVKNLLKFDDNVAPDSKSRPPIKGWKKALKMTSKQFKRKKDNQSRNPTSRVTLADYLECQNF